MRVRVKVPPLKEVLKLNTPEGCTLGQLRSAVALEVPGAAGPGAGAAGVLLSFNNKDPLEGGDDTPLRELGVCSGDTLWLLSHGVAAQAPVAATGSPKLQPAEPAIKRAREAVVGISQEHQQQQQPPVVVAADKGKQQAAAQEEAPEAMAVEDAGLEGGEEAGPPLPPSQRLPTYLLRTLQQSCSSSSSPAEVVFLAAHAAMLETGFMPCWADQGGAEGAGSSASSSSTTSSSAFQVPASARASSSISRVHYHLIAANNGSSGYGSVDGKPAGEGEQQQQQQQQQPPACTLQCSGMGGGGVVLAVSTMSHTRHLSLHAANFIRPSALPGGGAGPGSSHSAGGSSVASQTAQLLPSGALAVGRHLQLDAAAGKQLWTRLKDGLAFPMLLAAYAEAGLPPPAGLLALPEDLKQRVLTALEPQDLATLCGACSELRHLASQDDLWRPLFERQFPHVPSYFTTQAQQRGFKWAFGQCWREQRQREEALRRARNRMFAPGVPRFGVPRPPFYPAPHPGFPLMVGGDYDRMPQFGPGSGLPGQFGGGTAPGGILFGGGRRQGQGRGGLGSFRMH